MFAVVFAQLSTSVTDDQIRLVIIALLVVAALLGATTIWYFVHTSPRRRAAASAAAPRSGQAAAARPASPVVVPSADDAASTPAPTAYPGTVEASGRHDAAEDADFDDDEWMRLTAPQPPNPERTTDG